MLLFVISTTVFKNNSQAFCRKPSIGTCPLYFMIRLRLWIWGRTTEVKYHSHRIFPRVRANNMIIAINDELCHLTQVFLSGFSSVKLLHFPFIFQTVILHSPRIRDAKFYSFYSILYFFLCKRFFYLCHFFQSFMFSTNSSNNKANSSNNKALFHLVSISC